MGDDRRAPSFGAILHEMRGVYQGILTYSANWDDVDQTVILGDLDVIGINAFYPLAEKNGATAAELIEGGRAGAREGARARRDVAEARALHRDRLHDAPRSRRSPWEWPDAMATCTSTRTRRPSRTARSSRRSSTRRTSPGFFVWRVYADPGRRLAGGGVGILAARKAGGARHARRVRRAVGGGPRRARQWGARAEEPGIYPPSK